SLAPRAPPRLFPRAMRYQADKSIAQTEEPPMSAMPSTKDLPPFKSLPMLPPKIYSQRRADGSYIVRSLYDLGPQHRSIAHLLEERASQHPTRNLLAQRTPQGPWRYITYGEANQQASAIAQALLDRK